MGGYGIVLRVAERRLSDFTQLIGMASAGDAQASERLFVALYADLRQVALGQLRGSPAMRATSLVHETWLKLANHGSFSINDRTHYFATAARVMRQVVIDHVRSRGAVRRGGEVQFASLDTTAMQAAGQGQDDDVLALDSALEQLARVDQSLARLVEMRFYAGLELAEISTVLDRSERSLKRDWRRARAFLQRQMTTAQ